MKVRTNAVVVAVALAGFALTESSSQAVGPAPVGAEFPFSHRGLGDQVHGRVSLGNGGGWLIWQDPVIDGEGLGIAALHLNATLSPDTSQGFRVNQVTAGDQENPQIIALPNGGAFITWQTGAQGFQRVVGRVISPDGTFGSDELSISSGLGEYQIDPRAALLSNGDVVVVWSSFRQQGSSHDIYARRILANGTLGGPEFRVNATQGLSRRSPAVAATANGGFVAAWVSEKVVGVKDNKDSQGRIIPGTGAPVFEVTLVSRTFDAQDQGITGDQRATDGSAIVAHPVLATLPDQRFVLSWTQRDSTSRSNNLDIAVRVLDTLGAPVGEAQILNSFRFGDQYQPQLAKVSSGVLAIWSSMGQDGSLEGVYGRWINSDGEVQGDEFRANTTTGGGQILPAVAGTSDGTALIVWSSNLPQVGVKLFGQRFGTERELQALPAPFVAGTSPSSVMVTWPPVSGLDIARYRVSSESGEVLAEVQDTFWVFGRLGPSQTVQAKVSYVLTSGEVSPLSVVGTGKSWGADDNFDGLPDDWQALFWPGVKNPPRGDEDTDGDGASNLNEWLAGTNPIDPKNSLKVNWKSGEFGLRVEWATQPGFVYQLQSSEDGKTWATVGSPRLAVDRLDGVALNPTGKVAFYRVYRVR